ncbi:MAG: PAS domain S-box protein, partial [Anaerolineae bacterium]
MPDTTEMETHLTALFSEVGASEESQRDVPVSIQSLRESADARRQARRHEMVFQSLVDGAIDAISVGNLEGKLVYSNRACYDLFGYDFELQEMEDISFADLWPRDKAYASIKRVLLWAKRGGWSGETRMRCKDGGLFDAYLTAFSVMDGGDRPANVALIIRDISEQKAAEQEEAYRSRARQVRLVTEVSQEIASASSLDELYRRVVSLLHEVFGYWHVRLFRYDPDKDALVLVAACGQTGEGIEAERSLAAAKGGVIAAAAAGYPILIPDVRALPEWASYSDLPGAAGELAVSIKSHGQVLGVLDVLSDTAGVLTREDEILLVELAGQIANAIRSTRLLEEANVLHRFADASEGIGWITLEGGLFIYANSTLCSILGEAKPEDTFGKSILSYYPDELRQRVQGEVLPAALREGQWIGELSFVSARGKVVPTMQSIFLVRDDSGKPLYLANVVTDIFEQKQFESAADKRVRQIACLNDVGKRIETEPQISNLLEWVAERVPQAMPYPDVCVAAVVFEGASRSEHMTYGKAEAIDLPCQIKVDLVVCGEAAGSVCVSYTQEREFSDEDRMLLGDVGRRVSAYIESRRLAERAKAGLEEVMSAHRVYKPEHWTELVSKSAPSEETTQPEMAVPSGAGWRARLRKSRVYEILQRLLRRRPVRLLLLLLVPVLLAGMLFTTRGGFLAQGWPPTSTPKAIAAARFHSDSTVLTPLSTMPAVDPTSFPDPTSTSPVMPSALSTSLPSLSPTPLAASPIVFSPTPTSRSTDLVVPLPFPEVEPTVTPTLPISPPVQPVPVAADAVNIVVLGSDQRPDWTEWHTDVVQIVSIQRDRGVVSIISIPRDLYVYIPGFWMSRINFADYYGEVYGYEGGGPA